MADLDDFDLTFQRGSSSGGGIMTEMQSVSSAPKPVITRTLTPLLCLRRADRAG